MLANIKSKYQLLIFDFDGTIVNTKLGIAKTINQTLENFEIEPVPNSIITKLIGLPITDIFETITDKLLSEKQYSDMLTHYRGLYDCIPSRYTTFIHDMDKVLEVLYKFGLILTIATSRREESILKLLKQLNIYEKFQFVIADNNTGKRKPDPEIVFTILSKFNVPCYNSLIIGDSIYDIEMGKNANIDTCGVTYGSNNKEQMKYYKPTYIISQPKQLLKVIKHI